MSRLSKKEKKQLKRIKRLYGGQASQDPDTSSDDVFSIVRENFRFIVILIFITVITYANSIDNELTLIDDVQGFSENEKIKNLSEALLSGQQQTIVYGLSYHFFGNNPLPLRVNSVFLHTVNTILVFIVICLLIGKKAAILTSLIFSVHPVNSEAVVWISGMPYLYLAFNYLIIFMLFILFRKYQKKKYFYIALLFYSYIIFTSSSPWMLSVPIILFLLDRLFLLEYKSSQSSFWIFAFILPISIFLVTSFVFLYQKRIDIRTGDSHNVRMTARNEQSLRPVIQGYPYTLFMTSKLYLYPKTLAVYYDGNVLKPFFHLMMYIHMLFYIATFVFFWKKNRKVAGVMLIIPVLLAPIYSPYKITWFIAERYLYPGSMFFGVVISSLIIYLTNKKSIVKPVYGIFILMLAVSVVKVYLRNNDWQNTETISLANMRTSPQSVRPYNDIAGYYYYKGNFQTAVDYYEKALTVVPTSGTAINNLGYIYLEHTPLIFMDNFRYPPENIELSDKYFRYSQDKMKSQDSDARTIVYFLNKAMAFNPKNTGILVQAGEYYSYLGKNQWAKKYFELALEADPQNDYLLSRVRTIE